MNKMFFIAAFCCATTMANAQEFRELQDSHHNVTGYIGPSAQVLDKNKVFIGQFKNENYQYTVLDRQRKIIGHVINGGNEIQDASHKTIGYMTVDKKTYTLTFEDGAHTAVGFIKSDGTVEDASHAIIGYEMGTEGMWAGPYYFFFKFK